MKIEALLVANHASVRDSLLHVEGGGWEHYSAPLFPWNVSGVLGGVLSVEPEEAPVTFDVGIAQSGQVSGFVASMIADFARPVIEGTPFRWPFAMPFACAVLEPTTVKIGVWSRGGAELGAVAFRVISTIPDVPPPP